MTGVINKAENDNPFRSFGLDYVVSELLFCILLVSVCLCFCFIGITPLLQ